MTSQRVILNSRAGSLSSGDGIEPLLARLKAPVWLSESPGEFEQQMHRALDEGAQRIVIGGGDGSLNTALNALAGEFDRVELALLPLGTANDFARTVHVPADLEQAIAVIERGLVRPLDVGRLSLGKQTPHYFLNVSVGGFSSIAKQKLEETRKDLWKSLAYTLSAIKALPELTEYRLRIALDGEPDIEVPAYNVAIANAVYAGGGIPVAPEANLTDGLLDVVVFAAGTWREMAGVASKTWLGNHLEDDNILFRRAKHIELASTPAFDLNVDGETIGCCPATFDVLPGALRFVVGEAPAEE